MNSNRVAHGLLALGLTVLAGCASTSSPQALRPGLALPPRAVTTADDAERESTQPTFPLRLQQTETPKVTITDSASAGLDSTEELPSLGTKPVQISAQDMPIPAFINEVFGNLLGMTVSMDTKVSSLRELVTLNSGDPIAPLELFKVARNVLSDFGVAVSIEEGIARVALATERGSTTPPLIVSGRALPDVPVTHRPVFQLVELEVVRTADAQRWLSTVFGSELSVRDEPARNSLLISGKPMQVRQAIDALRVFDRPLMRGRISTRLEPAFLPADQLADRLIEVLGLQGYAASKSVSSPASVIVMPIQGVNSVLVFASTPQALEYTVSWAKELDRASPNSGSSALFYYQVRNTKAQDLARVLNGGGGEAARSAGQAAAPPATESNSSGNARGGGRGSVSGARFIVDEPRNALIYQGDAADWERMLSLIKQMDRAPRQVMIEVTIAEVTLDDGVDSGVQWFAKNGFGRFSGSIYSGQSGSGGGDDDSDSGGGNGLTYLLDVAGQNRMTLTALASDSRVSVLSTPRLLVKSGSDASIDIGTEVPTISMTTTSGQQTDGTSNLLQSVQYRKTGIILTISPTVYSDDRIDLDIEQEVSEALPLTSNATGGSPSIFNRSLATSLSLRDGGSVVMAGLISQRTTQSDSGIPLIKDVPLLGRLFKNNSVKSGRTELVLMIVPYIIESDDRATQVSQAIMEQFELLDLSTPTDE